MVGQMVGGIKDIEVETSSDEEEDDMEEVDLPKNKQDAPTKNRSVFTMFK